MYKEQTIKQQEQKYTAWDTETMISLAVAYKQNQNCDYKLCYMRKVSSKDHDWCG